MYREFTPRHAHALVSVNALVGSSSVPTPISGPNQAVNNAIKVIYGRDSTWSAERHVADKQEEIMARGKLTCMTLTCICEDPGIHVQS